MRILLIEDDECIAKSLETILSKENYAVDVAIDGEFGWRLIETFAYDLILLDVVLPKLDGITLCRQIREYHYQTPVLLLTARNSSSDRVIGLDAGADDYMVKPFELSELLARMRVLLRRGSSPVMSILEWNQLQLDPVSCQVKYANRPLQLTPKEYRLIELFLRNPRYVFSRTAILEHLWSVEEAPGEDTVTAHIKGLRQKLRQVGAPTNFIETIYGIGYRLKQETAAAPDRVTPVQLVHPVAAAYPEQVRQLEQSWRNQEIRSALQTVWNRYEAQNHDRVAVLDRAIAAMRANAIEDDLWQQAQQAAHKLAGALGLFERPRGSELARQLEQFFRSRQLPGSRRLQTLAKLTAELKSTLAQSAPSQPVAARPAPLLFLVEDANQIAQVLRTADPALVVEQAADLAWVWNKIANARSPAPTPAEGDRLPDLWLLPLSVDRLTDTQWVQLVDVARCLPPISVLTFTNQITLDWRIKLTRAGIGAVLPTDQLDSAVRWVGRSRSRAGRSAWKILMVDDDPQAIAVVQTYLQPWGLQLIAVEQSLQFWEVLQSHAPDLLILDVEMPNFSGIELCQAVRSVPAWQRLPIVFLTAHTDAATLQQVLDAGATALLPKPIAEADMVRRILRELHQSQLSIG